MAASRLAGRFPWRGPLVFGAEGPVSFNAVAITIDRASGRAIAIEQVQQLVEI